MRPHMVFVPIKNEEQQAVLMLHRTRDLLVRQRTMLVNAIRAHLAEFGIVAAQGRRKVKELITGLDNTEVPELARLALWQIADQIDECDKHIDVLERRILAGTSRTRPAATSPLSPASARSQPRRLPPRCPIHRLSGTVANWRHGWGWCHGNIRAAARTD